MPIDFLTSPGNAVNLPVVGGPDWRGLTHWRGIVWDPGIIGILRLRLCCDCLCLIALFRDVMLFVRVQTDSSLPVVGWPDWRGLTHWRGIVWDPGIIGILRLRLCCDCLCLIALFQDVMLFVRGQTDSSAQFLKDIGDWRTIVWELGSLGRDHPSC